MISYSIASSFKRILPAPSTSLQFHAMFVPPEFSQVNIRESQFEQQKVKNYCFPLDAVHYTVVTFSSQ